MLAVAEELGEAGRAQVSIKKFFLIFFYKIIKILFFKKYFF
jgi:hypothetical protein